jgi:hypothetical protein
MRDGDARAEELGVGQREALPGAGLAEQALAGAGDDG